jgi:regulator of sirC expression with transglutaminase-like and TPR domain
LDPTARFVALVQGPEDRLALDEAALCLAAHAHPDLDIGAQLDRLDELGSRCSAPTLEAVHHLLFEELAFSGNTDDYSDPANSFLNQVIDRRVGIPISLSVLLVEVARRAGVGLVGVGMPGHFLVRSTGDSPVLIDPFHHGRILDLDDCGALFRSVFGSSSAFSPSLLAAVTSRTILARMLANLERSYAERRDLPALVWVSRLRIAIPGLPAPELAAMARLLTDLGRFGEAADALEAMAAGSGERAGRQALSRAAALRARLN